MLFFDFIRFNKVLKGVAIVGLQEKVFPVGEINLREEESYKRGEQNSKENFEKQVQEFNSTVEYLNETLFPKISKEFNELKEGINKALPGLVFSIVEKVLPGIEMKEKDLEKIIEDILLGLNSLDGDIEIRLSQDDFRCIQSNKEMHSNSVTNIQYVNDCSLSKGDCVVKTKFGIVDGRLAAKLNKLEQELSSV